MPAKGRRKTQDPCPECFLHRSLCLCADIPVLNLKTKVSLIIHARELKRTTNTGRLALKALSNSELRVRGEKNETDQPLDLSDLLSPQYESLFFFPSDEAVELTKDFLKTFTKPIQLIVPDGNWRQASKVNTRHQELAHLPRVMISERNQARHHLRAESTEYGMSTLEAIAKAIAVIEGGEAGQKLQSLYYLKLERTLKARGVLKSSEILFDHLFST
jgi:DTW domain-containing protein YfiP